MSKFKRDEKLIVDAIGAFEEWVIFLIRVANGKAEVMELNAARQDLVDAVEDLIAAADD